MPLFSCPNLDQQLRKKMRKLFAPFYKELEDKGEIIPMAEDKEIDIIPQPQPEPKKSSIKSFIRSDDADSSLGNSTPKVPTTDNTSENARETTPTEIPVSNEILPDFGSSDDESKDQQDHSPPVTNNVETTGDASMAIKIDPMSDVQPTHISHSIEEMDIPESFAKN